MIELYETDKTTTATSVDDISTDVNFLNVPDYFCFYVKSTEIATGVTASISSESPNITFEVGKGLSGSNGTEGDEPTGVTFSGSVVVGDFSANDTQAIWVKRTVTSNDFCDGTRSFILEII